MPKSFLWTLRSDTTQKEKKIKKNAKIVSVDVKVRHHTERKRKKCQNRVLGCHGQFGYFAVFSNQINLYYSSIYEA